MRALAALLHGTGCPTLPPCHMVRPGLTVVIAESLETRLASEKPVVFQLVTLIHGNSPGRLFAVQLGKNVSLRKGDRFYIADILQPGQPLSLRCLTTSGPYSEKTHATRIHYFQDLNTDQIKHSSLNGSTRVPDATVTLTGPAGTHTAAADRRGYAEWESL
jgi:hypothetical protein